MTEHFKIAVIGVGNWGKNIVRVCKNLGALDSICDTNELQAKKFADEYQVLQKSWANILADEKITAVAIALPAFLHYKYATEALLAKKHIFVEKPLTMDIQSSSKLIALAEKQNKIVMSGHILQYHPAYIKLKQLVQEGEIGEIKYIESTRFFLGPIRYNVGVLWELLPHDISMLLGILNPNQKQHSIANDIVITNQNNQKFVSDEHVTDLSSADVIDVSLKYKKVKARICSSWLHPNKEQKFWVAGTKGMLIFEDSKPWDQKLKLYKYTNLNASNSGNQEFANTDIQEVNIDIEQQEPLTSEFMHFAECINNISSCSEPLTGARESLDVIRLLSNIERQFNIDNKIECDAEISKLQDYKEPVKELI